MRSIAGWEPIFESWLMQRIDMGRWALCHFGGGGGGYLFGGEGGGFKEPRHETGLSSLKPWGFVSWASWPWI